MGILGMHALDTHGAMTDSSMQGRMVAAVASPHSDPGGDRTNGPVHVPASEPRSVALDARALVVESAHLGVASSVCLRAAAPQLAELANVGAGGLEGLGAMGMTCLWVLALMLVLVVGATAWVWVGRQPDALRDVEFRLRDLAARLDHRPPSVWENSVLRC